MSSLVEKLAWMKANAYSLHISFNGNRDYYRTVEEYLADEYLAGEVSEDERAACIAIDQIVVIQVYPLSPVSFTSFVHAELSTAVDCAFAWLEKHLAEHGPYVWPVSGVNR